MSNKELDEFIEVTKQLEELQQKIIPLYNKQQVLLVKLRKKKNLSHFQTNTKNLNQQEIGRKYLLY